MHELATFVTFFTFLLITQSSLVGWFYDGHIQIKKSQHLKNSAYLQIYPFTRGRQIQQILTEVGKHLPIMQLNHSTVIRTVASTF